MGSFNPLRRRAAGKGQNFPEMRQSPLEPWLEADLWLPSQQALSFADVRATASRVVDWQWPSFDPTRGSGQ